VQSGGGGADVEVSGIGGLHRLVVGFGELRQVGWGNWARHKNEPIHVEVAGEGLEFGLPHGCYMHYLHGGILDGGWGHLLVGCTKNQT